VLTEETSDVGSRGVKVKNVITLEVVVAVVPWAPSVSIRRRVTEA
jgi:hypothetical protein